MASLKEQFSALQGELASSQTQEVSSQLKQATQRLVNGSQVDVVLAAGDRFPQFSLPNVVGNAINSEELLQQGPLVVSFFRGAWCPYCRLELRVYQSILEDIRKLGADFIAISPQLPEESLNMVAKANLTFQVLSDTGNSLAEHLGLAHAVSAEVADIYRSMGHDLERINGNVRWTLPIPATYVIDQDANVLLAYSHADHTRRLEPAQVLQALAALKR